MEVDDLASNCESVSKSKLSFEKTLRSCEDQLAEAQRKIEEQERMIAELNTEKDRIFQDLNTNRVLRTILTSRTSASVLKPVRDQLHLIFIKIS